MFYLIYVILHTILVTENISIWSLHKYLYNTQEMLY